MSQPETITLDYDPGTGTVTKTYGRFDASNSGYTVYTEANHTLLTRDEMRLYRTLPKKNGVYLGKSKTAVKITVDVPATDAEGNDITDAIIIDCGGSIPVAAADAVIDDALARMADFLLSTEGKTLFKKQEI